MILNVVATVLVVAWWAVTCLLVSGKNQPPKEIMALAFGTTGVAAVILRAIWR